MQVRQLVCQKWEDWNSPQALWLPPQNLGGYQWYKRPVNKQTNKTQFEWTSKQSSVIEEETWDRRRGEIFTYFLIFLWFHLAERKLQRLEWCDFDFNRNMRALKFIRKNLTQFCMIAASVFTSPYMLMIGVNKEQEETKLSTQVYHSFRHSTFPAIIIILFHGSNGYNVFCRPALVFHTLLQCIIGWGGRICMKLSTEDDDSDSKWNFIYN